MGAWVSGFPVKALVLSADIFVLPILGNRFFTGMRTEIDGLSWDNVILAFAHSYPSVPGRREGRPHQDQQFHRTIG